MYGSSCRRACALRSRLRSSPASSRYLVAACRSGRRAPRAAQAGAVVPLHHPPGHCRAAPVANAFGECSLPVEDPVPRRYHARHLRAAGFHGAPGGAGTQNTRCARGVGSAAAAGDKFAGSEFEQPKAGPEGARAGSPSNLTRYHGVFAPNSPHRAWVTKAGRGRGATRKASDGVEEDTPAARRSAMTWAQRLKRVFRMPQGTLS